MTDASTTLADLIREVEQFRDAREWAKFHSPKALASAISIEAAELMEHFQWRGDGDDFAVLSAAHELADILIYCLSFASVTDLDVSHIVRAKIEKNAEKYPVHEKGLEGWERNHK